MLAAALMIGTTSFEISDQLVICTPHAGDAGMLLHINGTFTIEQLKLSLLYNFEVYIKIRRYLCMGSKWKYFMTSIFTYLILVLRCSQRSRDSYMYIYTEAYSTFSLDTSKLF